MRFMCHHQRRSGGELRSNIYQLQVLLERKIVSTRMTIHENRLALRAELQILPKRLFKSLEIRTTGLMLMRHQQQLFPLQGIE